MSDKNIEKYLLKKMGEMMLGLVVRDKVPSMKADVDQELLRARSEMVEKVKQQLEGQKIN